MSIIPGQGTPRGRLCKAGAVLPWGSALAGSLYGPGSGSSPLQRDAGASFNLAPWELGELSLL